MGLSFERMNELSYLPDLATGADFLINTLEEFLPCSGIALHLLDLERREFVVFKALGPRAPEMVGNRQPQADSLLGASVQLGRAVRIEGIARKRLWSALGLDVAYGMCSPLQQRGRVLGAVELGRLRSEGEFSDGQLKTLQFICEQFAEFVAEHPFVPR
jgi:GAF domain-containing protein